MAKVMVVIAEDGEVETQVDCTRGHLAAGVTADGAVEWDMALTPAAQRELLAYLAPDPDDPGPDAHRHRRSLAVGAAALLARLAETEPGTVQRALHRVLSPTLLDGRAGEAARRAADHPRGHSLVVRTSPRAGASGDAGRLRVKVAINGMEPQELRAGLASLGRAAFDPRDSSQEPVAASLAQGAVDLLHTLGARFPIQVAEAASRL